MRASIRLRTETEGGQTKDGWSGMQPSMSIGGDLVACKISYHDELLMRGKTYTVRLELPYGEAYASSLREGMEFTLNVGARVIGTGIVEKLLDRG